MKLWIIFICLSISVGCGGQTIEKKQQQGKTMEKKISVEVTIPKDPQEFLKVMIKGNFGEAKNRRLNLPLEAVGGYEKFDFSPFIHKLTAIDIEGKSLTIVKEQDSYQITSTGSLAQVAYEVDGAGTEKILDNLSSTHRRSDYTLLCGYVTFLIIENTENSPYHLKLEIAEDWKIACSLKKIEDREFLAENIFQLIDEPIMMGTAFTTLVIEHSFLPGQINLYLENDENPKPYLDILEESYRSAADIMQVLKLPKLTSGYHMFFEIFANDNHPGVGWALEHGMSFYGSDSTGRLKKYSLPKLAYHFAHHMLHSWIPRRLYTDCLNPNKQLYAQPTDFIWFAEGFPQYMTFVGVAQAKVGTVEDTLGFLGRRFAKRYLKSAPPEQRSMLEHSRILSTTSLKYWHYGYASGGLFALLLDQKLRTVGDGKRGLEEVMSELLQKYNGGTGIPRERFAEVFSEVAGMDITEIYDKYVKNKNPLPVEEILAGVGIDLRDGKYIVLKDSEVKPQVARFRKLVFGEVK